MDKVQKKMDMLFWLIFRSGATRNTHMYSDISTVYFSGKLFEQEAAKIPLTLDWSISQESQKNHLEAMDRKGSGGMNR